MELIDCLKSVLDEYSAQQGWNETSQLDLLLSFLAHKVKADPSDLETYLAMFAEAEADDAIDTRTSALTACERNK